MGKDQNAAEHLISRGQALPLEMVRSRLSVLGQDGKKSKEEGAEPWDASQCLLGLELTKEGVSYKTQAMLSP